MGEKQKEVMKPAVDNPDLGIDVLMNKPFKKLNKEILKDSRCMAKIALDDRERHVRVLTFRILCENAKAIKKFNIISILLTFAILAMMIVQIILAVYK